MSAFSRSLRAEILKAKRSFAFWLAWIGTSFIVVSLFGMVLLSPDVLADEAFDNPWSAYINFFYAGTNFMLLPLFVIILASLVTYEEHRNRMWKHLLLLNVQRWHLYVSKLVFVVLLFAVAHLYFVVCMLLAGLLTGILQPGSGLLSHVPDMALLSLSTFRTIFSVLGLLSLQYWISMRFQSFIVPLGAGVIGYVMASIMIEKSRWSMLNPYAHPLVYTEVYQRDFALQQWGFLTEAELYSVGYFLLFACLGYWHTRHLDLRWGR